VDSGRLHRFSPLSTALQLLDGIQPSIDQAKERSPHLVGIVLPWRVVVDLPLIKGTMQIGKFMKVLAFRGPARVAADHRGGVARTTHPECATTRPRNDGLRRTLRLVDSAQPGTGGGHAFRRAP
jgi:hypothetical protein